MPVKILFRDEILCVAMWHDLIFETWFAPGSIAHFRTVRFNTLQSAQKYPTKRVSLLSTVKIESISGVDAEMRKEAAARAKEVRPFLNTSALVLSSKGFAASLIRGVMAGLSLVQRSAAPPKIFDSHEPAWIFLAPLLAPIDGRPVTPEEVRVAFEKMLAATARVGELHTSPLPD